MNEALPIYIYSFVSAKCPDEFIANRDYTSCYRIVTPALNSGDVAASSVMLAKEKCKTFHNHADLVSLETTEEKNFLAKYLTSEKRE